MPRAIDHLIPSRRHLFGTGAALLMLAPFAAGAAKASEIDGDLLALCPLLEAQQAEVRRVADDPSDKDMLKLDAALDGWWETVDETTDTRATTPEGIHAKAGAVRTVVVGTSGDTSPGVKAMLASLPTDMLGETVTLPV